MKKFLLLLVITIGIFSSSVSAQQAVVTLHGPNTTYYVTLTLYNATTNQPVYPAQQWSTQLSSADISHIISGGYEFVKYVHLYGLNLGNGSYYLKEEWIMQGAQYFGTLRSSTYTYSTWPNTLIMPVAMVNMGGQ